MTTIHVKVVKIAPSQISYPNVNQGNADVLATTAKTPLSEQGALKEEGIGLLAMPDD